MAFYVYILANKRNGTLYGGMTDDLVRRVWTHREGATDGFTKQYGVKTLAWFEEHGSRESAFTRERQMKMESTLEAASDREQECGVERPLGRNRDLTFTGLQRWIPAFAGMNGCGTA